MRFLRANCNAPMPSATRQSADGRRLGAYLIEKSAPRKKRNSIAPAAREPWAEVSAPNAKMPCGGAANGRLPLLPMDFGFVVARGNLWIFRRIPHYDERHGLYIFWH